MKTMPCDWKHLKFFCAGKRWVQFSLTKGTAYASVVGIILKKIDCVIENSSFSVRILERPLNFCVTKKNLVCVYCKKVFFFFISFVSCSIKKLALFKLNSMPSAKSSPMTCLVTCISLQIKKQTSTSGTRPPRVPYKTYI